MLQVEDAVQLRRGAFSSSHPINSYLGDIGVVVRVRSVNHIDVLWPNKLVSFGFLESDLVKEEPVAQFKVGDELVLDFSGRFDTAPTALPQPEGPGTVYVVTKHQGGHIDVRPRSATQHAGAPEFGGYYESRFKPAPAPAKTAMTIDAARECSKKLVAAGIDPKQIRIRTRTWDTEGVFFGIDILTATNATEEKLYSPAKVEEYIAKRLPTDITPYLTSTRLGQPIYQFRIQDIGNQFIPAVDGGFWWSEADIKAKGGIVTFRDKRYRLGQTKFVPFVG